LWLLSSREQYRVSKLVLFCDIGEGRGIGTMGLYQVWRVIYSVGGLSGFLPSRLKTMSSTSPRSFCNLSKSCFSLCRLRSPNILVCSLIASRPFLTIASMSYGTSKFPLSFIPFSGLGAGVWASRNLPSKSSPRSVKSLCIPFGFLLTKWMLSIINC
jgi:hypothetical protein